MDINGKGISILFPGDSYDRCSVLSDSAVHDLGLDAVCEKISDKPEEQHLILGIMSRFCGDPEVIRYRLDVFEDIYDNPDFRNRMLEILDKIDFLRDYGSFRRDYEESSGTWDLVHRLEEIRDYIDRNETDETFGFNQKLDILEEQLRIISGEPFMSGNYDLTLMEGR